MFFFIERERLPIYVNKYDITTHDESLNPFRSSDVANRDVEMIVVSSREKKNPINILRPWLARRYTGAVTI